MQRVEFLLIYFPEDRKWRLYSGDDYREIKENLTDLHITIAGALDDEGKKLSNFSSNIRESNLKA